MFAATVYLLAQSSGWTRNPLCSRLAVYIGDISYSTYLVHFFLWTVFKLLLVVDPRNVPLAMMALFLASTFAGSAILYRLVEQPGRKLVQGLAAKPRRATSVA
jgi:peptidoglycan/LPS O-acetylase OafA/YrhL